jgi:hypothetical protein
MPRPLDPRIADILRKYEEDPRDDKGVIWDCHGTWVVYHKALERVAAKAGVSFSKPDILRSERDEAVILCSGKLGEREDWEIGEALIGVNYKVSGKQAAYVYAMALKRARDRLILKLIGLHGLLYSEEESDDFRGGSQQQAPRQSDRHIVEDAPEDDGPSWSQMAAQSMADALRKRSGVTAIEAFLARDEVKDGLSRMDMDDHAWVMGIAAERKAIVPVTSGVAA